MVRDGKIGIGFSKDMVWLALGSPTRAYLQSTEKGKEEIWSYRVSYSHPSYSYCPNYGNGRRGHYGYPHSPTYTHVSYESIRVVFAEDNVTAIQQLEKDRGDY